MLTNYIGLSKKAAALLCAAAALACDESTSGAPTAPSPPRSGTSSSDLMVETLNSRNGRLLVPRPGQQRITAGGTFTQDFPDPVGSEVTFGLSAIKHRDSTFSGQFEYVTHPHDPNPLPVNQIHTHGVVDCFVLEGDLAIIGGRITKSNFDDIGMPIVINVTDLGESTNDPPDLASGLGAPGSLTACALHARNDQFPLNGGDVQVHTKHLSTSRSP
jgi:hypothetical protein